MHCPSGVGTGRHPLPGHLIAFTGLLVPLLANLALQWLAMLSPRAYLAERSRVHHVSLSLRLLGLIMQVSWRRGRGLARAGRNVGIEACSSQRAKV